MGAAKAGQQLAAARARLGRWRKSHGGRGRRIPEALWTDAVRVARVEGVPETARALRLRVERLKGLVGEPMTLIERDSREPGAGFVELTGMGPLGEGRTIVELARGGGEQMRIHLAGTSTADLVSLAEAFWSRRS
jgi:hypothetical protein